MGHGLNVVKKLSCRERTLWMAEVWSKGGRDMALMNTEGVLFLLRWVHFFAGITWIGLLYYFNFVQTPFFAEVDPAVRSIAIQKLVPRALWWFRWGAMFTVLAGLGIYFTRLHQGYGGAYVWAISLGGLLGTIMWANVWFVIWPNQKMVIASTTQVAQGGQPRPEAAVSGRRAGLTSRTNVLFSIPMLFYMGAAGHLPMLPFPRTPDAVAAMLIIGAVVVAAVELNALVGTQGLTKKLLDSLSGTFAAGFVLSVIFYALFTLLG
jgi:uncharacterized membrane protein